MPGISEHVWRHMQLNRTASRSYRSLFHRTKTEEKWRLHVTKFLWWMIVLVALGVPLLLDDILMVWSTLTRWRVCLPFASERVALWYRKDWHEHAKPLLWWMIPLFAVGSENTWKKMQPRDPRESRNWFSSSSTVLRFNLPRCCNLISY